MIRKIVLTGGPGSGKTTVIESIKKNYGGKYKVVVSDETASHLMGMGIRPFGDNPVPLLDFQELVLREQLSKEELINMALEYLPDKDIIVIFDRGILDNIAYISEEEFQTILKRLEEKYGENERPLCNGIQIQVTQSDLLNFSIREAEMDDMLDLL